jgi:hypothetical protein
MLPKHLATQQSAPELSWAIIPPRGLSGLPGAGSSTPRALVLANDRTSWSPISPRCCRGPPSFTDSRHLGLFALDVNAEPSAPLWEPSAQRRAHQGEQRRGAKAFFDHLFGDGEQRRRHRGRICAKLTSDNLAPPFMPIHIAVGGTRHLDLRFGRSRLLICRRSADNSWAGSMLTAFSISGECRASTDTSDQTQAPPAERNSAAKKTGPPVEQMLQDRNRRHRILAYMACHSIISSLAAAPPATTTPRRPTGLEALRETRKGIIMCGFEYQSLRSACRN